MTTRITRAAGKRRATYAPMTLVLALVCSAAPVDAIAPPVLDSVHISAVGEAATIWEQSAGAKADAAGCVRISASHAFTGKIAASAAILTAYASRLQKIEHAVARLRIGNGSFETGLVHVVRGADRWYHRYAIDATLTRVGRLVDLAGIGAAGEQGGAAHWGAAAMLGSRENGAAALWAGYDNGGLDISGVCCFQAYTEENQDHEVWLGLEFGVSRSFAKLHAVVTAAKWPGFGKATNPTMVPGDGAAAMIESELVVPAIRTTIGGQVLYEYFTKRYTYERFQAGAGARIMIVRFAGLGATGEYVYADAAQSYRAAAGILLQAREKNVSLRAFGVRAQSSGSHPVYRIKADMHLGL